MTEDRRCKNCDRWASVDGGRCGWMPPPLVAEIIKGLQAEPATHINWQTLLDYPSAPAHPEGYCSAWAELRRTPSHRTEAP